MGLLNGRLGLVEDCFLRLPDGHVPEYAENSLVRDGKRRSTPMEIDAADRPGTKFFVDRELRFFQFKEDFRGLADGVDAAFRLCTVG